MFLFWRVCAHTLGKQAFGTPAFLILHREETNQVFKSASRNCSLVLQYDYVDYFLLIMAGGENGSDNSNGNGGNDNGSPSATITTTVAAPHKGSETRGGSSARRQKSSLSEEITSNKFTHVVEAARWTKGQRLPTVPTKWTTTAPTAIWMGGRRCPRSTDGGALDRGPAATWMGD